MATEAVRAADFTNSIGVETHLDHSETPYSDIALVKNALAYLNPSGVGTGVDTVRDETWSAGSGLDALGALGYQLDIYTAYTSPGSNSASDAIDAITPLVDADYVRMIEGPLEVDNSSFGLTTTATYTALNGVTYSGWQAAVEWQKDLYVTFGSKTEVALFSLANPTDGAAASAAVTAASQLGTSLSAISNVGNVHFYEHGGNAPSTEMGGVISQETAYTSGEGFAITETGFNSLDANDGTNYWGSQYSNGVYTLNLVLDSFKAGSRLTDIYELFDESSSVSGFEGHWGLFNADGTPKLSATYLHNMMSVLGDPGANAKTFQTGSLTDTITGLGPNGNSLLMEKSNGAYDLAVWSDADIYVNGIASTAPAQKVTVNLGNTYASVEVFDPTVGTTATENLTNVSSVTLEITDHPVIIEIESAGGASQSVAPEVGPPAGAAGTSASTTPTATLTDTAGQSASDTDVVTASTPAVPIALTASSASQSTASTASVKPFAGAAITDANAGQSETVAVSLSSAANGTISDPSSANDKSTLSNGVLTLTGAAADVARELAGLVFTPSAGKAGTSVSTTLTARLTDTAGQTASLTDTVMVATAAAAPAGSNTAAGPAASPAPATITLGSGADKLALQISEDAWQGNAQFTVAVNGVQVGGVQTATALHATGTSQTVDVLGNFLPGQNTVSVDFLNDAYDGTPSTDRNLYVGSATINGAAVPSSNLTLLSQGTQSFNFQQPSATPTTVTLGSGPDTLALAIAEDAWQGDAQFTVSVDGQQVGGVQTATASQAAGATQTFDVDGNFSPGQHTVSVNFLNDAYAGSPSMDRNLYVDGATIDGTAISGSSQSLYWQGSQGFSFTQAAPTVIGTGADSISLGVAEDAWQGDAQYVVTVDGQQVGGVQTATASHGAGAIQDVTVNGNWGTGAQTIGISFINDAYGGSPTTDRNLYVDSLSYDGQSATPASATLLSNGTTNFTVPAAGTGTVTLLLSGDYYQGSAQYTVDVDGKQVGGTGSVSAVNASGQTQAVNIPGVLSAGVHNIAVSFTNDLYAGTPQTDRNLYVKGIDVNGTQLAGDTATLFSSGTAHFSVVVPAS